MIQIVSGVVVSRPSLDPYKCIQDWEDARTFQNVLMTHEVSYCSNQNWPSLTQIAESFHNPLCEPVKVEFKHLDPFVRNPIFL
jgi:hypothetical protein